MNPPPQLSARWRALCTLIIALALASLSPLAALADKGREHSGAHPLHFTHPLITESPSPDTKIRLDYFYERFDEPGERVDLHRIRLEAEYAFHPSVSLEADVPLARRSPGGEPGRTNFDTVSIGLKLANFAFADHGLLLGYGFEVGLPTGDDEKEIGSDHIVELEPFFNVGFQRGPLELIGFAHFGIPTNQDPGEEVETELGYNLAGIYRASDLFRLLLELEGETVLSGEEDGATVLNLAPGVLLYPASNPNFMLGAAAAFPLTRRKEFEPRLLFSGFYHF